MKQLRTPLKAIKINSEGGNNPVTTLKNVVATLKIKHTHSVTRIFA